MIRLCGDYDNHKKSNKELNRTGNVLEVQLKIEKISKLELRKEEILEEAEKANNNPVEITRKIDLFNAKEKIIKEWKNLTFKPAVVWMGERQRNMF